ncbi:MAG: M48 family metallopeptidase [Verrucomicrobia bacterium]|nr:M48 family metallopeptidase [Verrucomicrobiota bacterium]
MDFFARQESARGRTRRLVVYFGLAVVLTILAIYAALALIFLDHTGVETGFDPSALWDPRLFIAVAAGTLAIVAGGSLSKMAELRRGGGAVAEMLGGRLVRSDTHDPAERRLLNVVEEMALASGTAVPPVYLLEGERGINAFAAGHGTGDAVIGVTEGCLRRLTRDELQGVIAHEFSHILNGDMRLNLKLVGVIFGLVCLTVLGRILLRSGGGGDGRKRNPLPLVGLVLVVAGWIGVFFGRLIQAAVSRQREFLADAAAVQFTRNPGGLAGALKKIGGLPLRAKLTSPHADEAGHLFFGNARSDSFLNWMSTHPPLLERIRAMEPHFDGDFAGLPPAEDELSRSENAIAGRLQGKSVARAEIAPLASGVAVAEAMASIGQPRPMHLELAREWKSGLDPGLLEAVRNPQQAPAVVWAALISEDEEVARRQLGLLREELEGKAEEWVTQWRPLIRELGEAGRLPIIELCLSALRQLQPEGYERFAKSTRRLIEADEAVDLFEFALEKCLERHLAPHFEARPRERVEVFSLVAIKSSLSLLVGLAAKIGQNDERLEREARRAGWSAMGFAEEHDPACEVGLAEVNAALTEAAKVGPALKKKILFALAITAAHDAVLGVREAEFLRAVADVLDCPVPPFLELHRHLS